jgi:hypothetical protein
MIMTFSQYCRIETAAGGTRCTNRQFIYAALQLVHDGGMRHEWRDMRHQWIKSGLYILEQNRAKFRDMGA